jgi:hypothetical protein
MNNLHYAIIAVLCLVLFPIAVSAGVTEKEIALRDIQDLQKRTMQDAFPELHHTGKSGLPYVPAFELVCKQSDFNMGNASNESDKDVLKALVVQEFAEVNKYYHLTEKDAETIQNRSVLEKSWVFIFGRNAGITSRMDQNIEQYRIHSCRMLNYVDQCNCKFEVGSNMGEYLGEYSGMTKGMGQCSYCLNSEKNNKGIIGNALTLLFFN